MKKALKIIFITAVCLCLVIIIGGYIALTQVDFNRYKGMIETTVYNATGRKLALGDVAVKPSFNPVIEIKDVSFANATWANNPVMAKAQSVDLGVAVLPLLKKNIVIDTFKINNAEVNLEERADGMANWEFDVPGKTEEENKEVETSFKFELIKSAEAVEIDVEKAAGGNKEVADMLSSIVVKQLAFDNVIINYQDKSGKSQTYDIESLKLDENRDKNVDFSFNVNKGLYSGQGMLGALSRLQSSEGYPVKADVNVMGINVGVDMKLFDVLSDIRFDGNVTAKGFMGKNSGYGESADVSVKGDLKKVEAVINSFVLSGNKITGKAQADLAGNVPNIQAALNSDKIDIKSFEEKAQTAFGLSLIKSAQATSLVPQEKIDFEALGMVNANVDVNVAQVTSGQAVLVKNLVLNATVNNKTAVVKVLKGQIAQGTIKADATLNGNNRSLGVNAAVNGLNLAELMKTLNADTSSFNFISGSVTDLYVNLNGTGNTYAEVVEGLNGQIVGIVDKSELHLGNIGMMKGNIVSQLFNTLNITKGNDDLNLKCAVVRADVANGLAKFPSGVVLNADKFTIVANGDVNLKNDKISFSVKPFAGKLTDTNIAKALSSLVKLTGTIQSPSIGVDSANAIKTIVGVTTSGPVYLGAQMLLENDGSPCYTALAGTGYESRFPKPENVAKTTSEDVGKILDDSVGVVKDTTKGLFNLLTGKVEKNKNVQQPN
ncbi:MAG: AsmA family protein [Alphaproteobacteria bacterium]|nr:AsmA family protein [Alphaproteobacteria bacterium]